MDTSVRHDAPASATRKARQGAHAFALWGLVTRGILYIVLAVLAIGLATGETGNDVDTRGAFHQLAHESVGAVLLVLLAIGFAGFALWHLYVAVRPSGHDDPGDRLANVGRAVVYGALCVLAISFLATSKSSGNSDRTDKTWTAKVLDWSIGPYLVGAIGIVIIGIGCYLGWRAVSGGPQDEPAVVDAAPRETDWLHWLGAVGNVARGVVVVLVGAFLLDAAIEYDPDKTVGLDGTLRRILHESYGTVLVVLVALGFLAFGVYSIGRAIVNRRQATDGHATDASRRMGTARA